VFGIMDFVNLAHGSLYMMAPIFAATFVPGPEFCTPARSSRWLRHCCSWIVAGVHGAAASLRPRHLGPMCWRPSDDPVLQRGGAADLGPAGLALPLPPWLSVPVQIIPAFTIRPIGWRSSWSRWRSRYCSISV